MKKVFRCIITMVVIFGMMITVANAENKYNYRDYLWINSVKDEWDMAFEEGQQLEYYGTLYDGIMYYSNASLYLEDLGYKGNRDEYWNVAEHIENMLREEGAIFPQVKIRRVGMDGNTNEWIYEFSVYMMENINEYQGSKSGSGFIADGLNFNAIKGIGKFY